MEIIKNTCPKLCATKCPRSFQECSKHIPDILQNDSKIVPNGFQNSREKDTKKNKEQK